MHSLFHHRPELSSALLKRLLPRRKRSIKLARSQAENNTPALPKYERMKDTLLDEHGIRVQRWRSTMSGVAILARSHDGTIHKLLEAPYPRGPVSAAVFCHEVAHHIIGVGSVRPRCLEELLAWDTGLSLMKRFEVPVTNRVLERRTRSMRYAVAKARRAGLKDIPEELTSFI